MSEHAAAGGAAGHPGAQAGAQPDWDLSSYFPELGGEAYCAFRDALAADLAQLNRKSVV